MLRCQFKVFIPKQQRGQPYPKVSLICIMPQPPRTGGDGAASQRSPGSSTPNLGQAEEILISGAGAQRQDVRAVTTMTANIS